MKAISSINMSSQEWALSELKRQIEEHKPGSQGDFAKMVLGRDPSTVSRYVTGKSKIPSGVRWRLAARRMNWETADE